MDEDLVLVTGGTGFVGVHCIVRLLAEGTRVRATVRDLARADDLRALVRLGGGDPSQVDVVAANLLDDAGWDAAARGATHVLHVASPFPAQDPKDHDELIRPAREGTLRVLRAARDAGVRRVVQTSSFAAIGYGHRHSAGHRFTEADWTDPDAPGVRPYVRSKTLAERAAWDYVDGDGGGLELAVVNPVAVFGPAIGDDLSTSLVLLLSMLNGVAPALPNGRTNAVDARDVADLHLLAMRHPDAAGERFLAVSGDSISFPEMAAMLRAELGDRAPRIPRRTMPDWVVRVLAPFVPDVRAVASELGRKMDASHEKATRMLGWTPRSREEAILASAESLIALGLVTR
ncbi:SDR family oxidoreductase [Agromyces sp. ZXT2-3]|uniref:SDR family oxidoreductase n=1 Tax=Agromyces sp. ZXT2-3 TaxID=3461152 RepID=UPI004055150E